MYAAAMVWAHPRMIYPFGPDAFDNPAFQQEVISDREVSVVIAPAESDIAVLFFMGNGGALAYFSYTLDAHMQAGRTTAAMEYPGGGGIPGKASERSLKADALTAYDWLAAQHDGPIVVHGFSLGTGLAIHVAARRPVAAILLDAPYVTLCELMTKAAYLPACYMPGVQRWRSVDDIDQLDAPVLIQHGTADQLIPMSNGARLSALMQNAGLPVTFHAIDGATHNNLAGQPGYDARITTFLEGLQK